MDIHSLIIEQLEWNQQLKSFTIQASPDHGPMWVAFPTDYQDDRVGPFHFLDDEYENLFQQREAKCRDAKLSDENFFEADGKINFRTSWSRMPIRPHSASFYALYLPEFAAPDTISILDTQSGKRLSKRVYRDDKKHRFIIYLECVSRSGTFSFRLDTQFHRDEENFSGITFHDDETEGFSDYPMPEHWHMLLPEQEVEKVNHFFADKVVVNNFNPVHNQTVSGLVVKNNNAWVSGLFYGVLVIVFLAVLAMISNLVHWAILPVIILGGVLLVTVVGALQLKNDDRLSDESFISLMTRAFQLLPFFKKDR